MAAISGARRRRRRTRTRGTRVEHPGPVLGVRLDLGCVPCRHADARGSSPASPGGAGRQRRRLRAPTQVGPRAASRRDRSCDDVTMPKIIGGSLHEHREQTRHQLFAALSDAHGRAAGSTRSRSPTSPRPRASAAPPSTTTSPTRSRCSSGSSRTRPSSTSRTLERALADVDDPVEQLRTYVRQQSQLKRVFHLAPGPDLRAVLSRGDAAAPARARRPRRGDPAAHPRRGHRVGAFPAAGPRHHRAAGQRLPVRPRRPGRPERERADRGRPSFVLRAVGARLPVSPEWPRARRPAPAAPQRRGSRPPRGRDARATTPAADRRPDRRPRARPNARRPTASRSRSCPGWRRRRGRDHRGARRRRPARPRARARRHP